MHWHELNSSPDYVPASYALYRMAGSLAQLVHHKEEILATLLSVLRPEAILSLEPVIDLLAALARDLQGESTVFLFCFVEFFMDGSVAQCYWHLYRFPFQELGCWSSCGYSDVALPHFWNAQMPVSRCYN